MKRPSYLEWPGLPLLIPVDIIEKRRIKDVYQILPKKGKDQVKLELLVTPQHGTGHIWVDGGYVVTPGMHSYSQAQQSIESGKITREECVRLSLDLEDPPCPMDT